MSTSKYVDKICIAAISLTLVITMLFMSGEKLGITVIHREEDENTSGMFTSNDLNAEWDTEDASKIILDGDTAEITGNGAYFSNNILHIAYAGKYVISGTLNGSVHIDADGDDKIRLLFDGVDITSKNEPPLYINQADKVFITLKEDSQNTLTFENEDEKTEADGCIFSRDDLTVNGKGNLTVTSSCLHGIVCNDTLVFTGGNINIKAKNDAVHAHDGIKICNASLIISAGDDGLHAGNDENESAVFYMESGNINITECYEGIEANDITIAGGTVNITPTDDGINACGMGKTSQITVSGGDITVINKNGRDADGFDSNGNISITGGKVFISVTGTGTNNAVDYGSECGGKFTITGGTIIACGASQMTESPDSNSAQGFIMQSVSGKENETLCVLDETGKEIICKEIPCSFSSALISSPDIAVGDTVTLKIGDTETEITVYNTVENGMGNMGIKGGFNQGGEYGQNPFEKNNGNGPPKLPDNSDGYVPFQQRPDGDNAPPQKPDGDFPGGDMPEGFPKDFDGEIPVGQNGTPPEIPDDGNQDSMQMPDENMQGEIKKPNGEQAAGENEQPDSLSGQRQKSREQSPEGKSDRQAVRQNNNSNVASLILILVSIIVLAVGLLIALKKKY